MAEELTIQKKPWERFREYVSEVRVEMKRVTWPGKQEVYGTTMMVILTTFAFGAFFWICDLIFSHGMDRLLKYLLHRG